MKLSKIRIQNFRSIHDETINFDDYTCLVGPNSSGKSVILTALNVFFQNNDSTATDVSNLSIEDFHYKRIDDPIIITLTFIELPDINDSNVSDKIKDMLTLYSRHGELVICAKAEWNEVSQSAPVKQYGSRLVMEEFSPYFQAEKEGTKVADLKPIYLDIQKKYPELPKVSTGKDMKAALRSYEENHPKLCVYKDEDAQFYGFTSGQYLLNELIQWVYIPAVKDASSEQEESSKTALGQLLQRTIRKKIDFKKYLGEIEQEAINEYEKMLKAEEQALLDLQSGIERQLCRWTNPNARLSLQWNRDPSKSIQIAGPKAKALMGDGAFIGEIARLGHGMQRGFLVAILSELARGEGGAGPKLLLGFEEPELYQHPPQAQHMASVLEELTGEKGDTQVIVTTHSPYFVTSKGFECVRLFQKTNTSNPLTKISFTNYQKVNKRIADALGKETKSPNNLMATISQIMQTSQKELFFASKIILVEGPEDIGFISTYLHLTGKWEDFRRHGCHFIVAGGKRNIDRFLAIAQELEIPTFLIFDSDNLSLKQKLARAEQGDDKEKVKSLGAGIVENNEINNCLLKMCGFKGKLNGGVVLGGNLAVWPSDLYGTVVNDFGQENWSKAKNTIAEKYNYHGVSKKNGLVISGVIHELVENRKMKSEILDALCTNIIGFAEIN